LEQDALCKLAAAPTDVFNSYGPLAQSAASPLLRGLKRPKPSLSYRRHKLTTRWIEGFQDRLTYWLTQELGGRDARVFFDIDSIEVGDHWPNTLREALKTSRCMVGLWSSDYFRSRWCMSEWRSFLEREKQAGLQSGGLVAPIKCHDGEYFPIEARSIQQFDLSQYWYTVSNFWETLRAVEADESLKKFAKHLAIIVHRAPSFNPNWRVIEASPEQFPACVPLQRL